MIVKQTIRNNLRRRELQTFTKTMWLLLCLYLFGAKAWSAELPTFQKCCPERLNLIKVDVITNDTKEVQYQCLDREDQITYNVSNREFPLILRSNIHVKYGLPQACDIELLSIPKIEDMLSSNGKGVCYDRLVGDTSQDKPTYMIPKLVALKCITNQTEAESSKFPITQIRKCCPRGHDYDTKYHTCRKRSEDDDEEWIANQIMNSSCNIYEVEVGLHCKLSEYAVELKSDNFTFSLDGTSLEIVSTYDGSHSLSYHNEWCIDRMYSDGQMVARVCTKNCSIYDAFCVRKCCPVGQHFKPSGCNFKSTCVPNIGDTFLYDLSPYVSVLSDLNTDVYGIRSSLDCPNGRIVLNSSSDTDHHELTMEGELLFGLGVTSNYCIEMFDFRHCNADVMITAAKCYEPPSFDDFKLSFKLITISSGCLALTLLVYCTLPELRNQHGRTLICHLCTMLLAFGCLARVQYAYIEDKVTCTLLAYGIYFGFVAAFAWLNVMCFDMWWTFRTMRSVRPLRRANAEKKRFIWYSVYVWGSAILMTLTTFLLDNYPISPHLDSNMGDNWCFFGSLQDNRNYWPQYILFVIPIGIVTCVNFVLWVLTARHCARVKFEVYRQQAGFTGDRMKRRFRINREKFLLTGKLWVVMGAGWIFEPLSTVVGKPRWLCDIFDVLNKLQGVFIFIILVLKPSELYYLAKKKLGLEKPNAQKNGTTAPGRTSSTLQSRSVSTDERVFTRESLSNKAKQK